MAAKELSGIAKAINWFMTPSASAPSAPLREKGTLARRHMQARYGGTSNLLFAYSYNGEKNLGELGPAKNYKPNYEMLRIRSWQAYFESESAQMVLNKYTLWIIGAGLKLQASPVKNLLKEEGIELNTESFNNSVESRFGVWAGSNMASYDGMTNLHNIAHEAHKNAIIGGDVLVLLRFDPDTMEISVQLVDGAHVQSPIAGSEWWPQTLPNGNTLVNGIEMDKKGQHVAYYVCKPLPEFGYERIEARNNGIVMAFMVYGLKCRLDNKRGMSLISCVLETMKKLERYKEATVGSAEERQKIVYTVEHGVQSTGESPLLKQLATAHDYDSIDNDLPADIAGRELASTVAASTNKQTFNLPVDSKLTSLASTNELSFKDFYTVNLDLLCATVGIPPNVAMSQYNDSFSASRAATKDWEHTIKVNRENFTNQFYKHVYKLFLTVNVLKNKINAPGFLAAYHFGNYMVIEAYLCARFTGDMFPHIDPLKEVKAEREKLGPLGAHLPLTTIERATEVLEGGDSESNMEQFADELADAEMLGLKPIPVAVPGALPAEDTNGDEGDTKKKIKKGA